MKEINLKIKQLREMRSYTQEYMADQLRISNSTYSRIETGLQDITVSRLAEIADILKVEIWEMFAPDGKLISKSANDTPVETILQIKLKKETQEQVLKLVFGTDNVELLNK